MVAEIARQCPNHLHNVEAATAAVMKREASMPTGLDRGIAVPHGRDACVKGIVGAVAIVADADKPGGGIQDYETIDRSAVRIIVLTLANSESQTPYLKLMSFISRALRAENGASDLAKCTTADEMRRFFRKAQ
jgi:PTS system fructose-specific IIC component